MKITKIESQQYRSTGFTTRPQDNSIPTIIQMARHKELRDLGRVFLPSQKTAYWDCDIFDGWTVVYPKGSILSTLLKHHNRVIHQDNINNRMLIYVV